MKNGTGYNSLRTTLIVFVYFICVCIYKCSCLVIYCGVLPPVLCSCDDLYNKKSNVLIG